MSELTPDQVQKIHKLLHDKQVIQAIQVYRDATGVSLANAQKAIEEMALVEVVKIYREEYGIGLKEAKVAVERIEASMPRDSATGTPYESAIGRDPFAEQDGTNRGRIVILAVALIIALCGVGGIILILLSNP